MSGKHAKPANNLTRKENIIHRRWLIVAIISLIIITIFHAWTLIAYIVGGIIAILLLGKFINWLSGADLDHNPNPPHQHNDVSDTLWDIKTLDEIEHHHDHFDD